MKCVSLTQPYASAIPLGLKRWETRSWHTKYRGPLGIHAAKGFPRWAREFAEIECALGRMDDRVPLGAIVAVVDLAACLPTTEALLFLGDDRTLPEVAIERRYGDYSPGRFAWKLENIQALAEPIPCKGRLGLWTPSPELEQAIMDQLRGMGNRD